MMRLSQEFRRLLLDVEQICYSSGQYSSEAAGPEAARHRAGGSRETWALASRAGAM